MSQTSPDFQTFHLYNRLVRRGFTKPLTHSCGNEFVLTIGDEEKPVLRCFNCGTMTFPGLGMFADIKAVVTEHFG